MLYNTDKSPDPDGSFVMENPLVVPKNCAILMPVKQVESDMIQYVKNMKSSNDFMDFDNKFGHSKDAKVADILWLCSSMFSSSGKQIRVPQIMWFTDEDQPHPDGSNDQHQAFQKATDLQQLQLDLQFYPMKMDFDGDLFYKELLCQLLGYDPNEFQFPTPQLNEKILLQRMFRRGYNKRALAHLTVELSPNAKFGVGVFSFTRKTFVPQSVLLSRASRQQIVAKRSYKYGTIEEGDDGDVANVSNMEAEFDYAEKLEPSMMVKYQLCGSEKIKFTPLEAYEIKQVMEPKIKILGFKPSSVLSQQNHIKGPFFLYPNDSHVKNSGVLFRALWERCLADDKIIFCIFTMRLKSYPRLVALVPQEQQVSADGEIQRYDGFRMEFIPFAGDVRDLSEIFTETPTVDQDVSSAMKKIIGKLRVIYAPSMFENPAVRHIYKQIEAEVFDQEPDEELNRDATLPNLDAQDERIGQFVDMVNQLVADIEDAPPAKRKASDAPAASQRKKVSADDINSTLILQKCQAGQVKDLTIPTLKAYLELKNVKGISKLNKAQCVEKILELA